MFRLYELAVKKPVLVMIGLITLITMGAIAALGEPDTFCIQVRAGIKNGEFNAVEAREMLIHLAQYVGYPRVAGLVGRVEQVLAELQKGEGSG